ncbi:MAG: hypothetical protein SGJ27_17310 [Candidatus Melainabacteria bacterium]|nr:hypothetical protein [Candidatus Melainabacteria bacterium]
MIHFHPPGDQVRASFNEFRPEPLPRVVPGKQSKHSAGCACCHVANPKSNANELKLFAVIIFAVTITLVGMNAYQRDRINKETAHASHGSGIAFGPGATQAAETTFPTMAPTAGMYNTVPVMQEHTQYAYVPIATVRPGEPALQYMAVPYNDGRGTVRLKRVVGR